MDEARPVPVRNRDFLTTLRRRFWVVLEVGVAVTVAAALAAQVKSPIYEATATILLTSPQQQVSGVAAPPEAPEQSNPQIQVRRITSAALLDQVRNDLNLAAGLNLHNMVAANITEPAGNANVVSISVRDTDPQRAAKVADEVATVFQSEQQTRGAYATEHAIKFVTDQLASISKQLSAQELAIENFQREQLAGQEPAIAGSQQGSTSNAQGSGGGGSSSVSQLVSIDSQLESQGTQIKVTSAQLAKTNAELARTPAVIKVTKMVANPMGASLRQQIAQLEINRTAKLADYKPNSPEIHQLDQEIENLKQMLAKEKSDVVGETQEEINPVCSQLETQRAQLEYTLNGLQAGLQSLEQLKAKHVRDVAAVPAQETESARLERKRSILESLFNMLQSRYYELEITKAQQPRTVEILQDATVPTSPVEPNKAMYYAVGVVFGGIMGLILAGLIDQFDDTFADTEEVERLLGLPVLGMVPFLSEGELRLTRETTSSAILETFRALRSNLLLSSADHPIRSLLVTSATPAEGKTETASDLAIAMALDHKQVVLIDADLRRPGVHRRFGLSNERGVTSLAVGACEYRDALQETDIPGLRVMTSGPLPPNPPELLNSQAWKDRLQQIVSEADFVIIDTPPALMFTDAQVLAGLTDGTLLVLSAKDGHRHALARTVELLHRTGAKMVGTLVNKATPHFMRGIGRGDYYYYYYYHYYYPSGEGRDEPRSARRRSRTKGNGRS